MADRKSEDRNSGFVDAMPHQNKNRRMGGKTSGQSETREHAGQSTAKKKWSTWLIVLGALFLIGCTEDFSFGDLIIALAMLAAGLFIKFNPQLKQKHKEKYDGIINYRGNTSLQDIATYMGKSIDSVCQELQAMIKEGHFYDATNGHDAYIDRDYMMLVMTKDDVPMRDPAETVQKKQDAEKFRDDSGFVKDIREAIDVVEDENMTNCLYDLEGAVRRIEAQIKKKPELKSNPDIIKLNNYYLPEMIKLINKYTEGQMPGVMASIEDALETCTKGLEGIEKEITEADTSSTEIDIKVLKDTFKRDGLLGSDFDISG